MHRGAAPTAPALRGDSEPRQATRTRGGFFKGRGWSEEAGGENEVEVDPG